MLNVQHVKWWRVLGRDGYQILDAAVDTESREKRHAGINQAYGPGDDDAAATEPGEPRAWWGMAPLHSQSLAFPLIEPANRDQSRMDHVLVSTIQSCLPGLQPIALSACGDFITTAASPVNQLS